MNNQDRVVHIIILLIKVHIIHGYNWHVFVLVLLILASVCWISLLGLNTNRAPTPVGHVGRTMSVVFVWRWTVDLGRDSRHIRLLDFKVCLTQCYLFHHRFFSKTHQLLFSDRRHWLKKFGSYGLACGYWPGRVKLSPEWAAGCGIFLTQRSK